MKAKHYTLFGLFAVLMALMPITDIMAANLSAPATGYRKFFGKITAKNAG